MHNEHHGYSFQPTQVRKLRPIDDLSRPSLNPESERPLFEQLRSVAAVPFRRSASLPVLIPRLHGDGDRPRGRIGKQEYVELGSAIARSRPALKARRAHHLERPRASRSGL